MLVAYLDEVAEAGAFVSKTHKNYRVIGHCVLLEG